MNKILRYNSYRRCDFDDIGLEMELDVCEKKTAVLAYSSEDENLWFFEESGIDAAKSYEGEFKKDGFDAKVIPVPEGVILYTKKEKRGYELSQNF